MRVQLTGESNILSREGIFDRPVKNGSRVVDRPVNNLADAAAEGASLGQSSPRVGIFHRVGIFPQSWHLLLLGRAPQSRSGRDV